MIAPDAVYPLVVVHGALGGEFDDDSKLGLGIDLPDCLGEGEDVLLVGVKLECCRVSAVINNVHHALLRVSNLDLPKVKGIIGQLDIKALGSAAAGELRSVSSQTSNPVSSTREQIRDGRCIFHLNEIGRFRGDRTSVFIQLKGGVLV